MVNPKNLFRLLWGGFFLLLAYWGARLWDHFPAFMDTVEYVFPEKWFNVESFRQGRIPLWNPYVACGTPHVAALQPAAFYPFFWLWNLTGLTHWFFIMALLHEAWAAVGFYLWLKGLKVSPLPATLCAMGFAGSALTAFYWGFPTHLASIAWVPWIFWAAHRLGEKPSVDRWALLSVFWAFQILAGYPFFTFYAFLFACFTFRWKWRAGFRPQILHAGAFLAALGLTACQWLPFADFLGYLHRQGWGGQVYSLRWVNFLTLLQPDILGVPGTTGYKGDYPSYIFNDLYLGLVPLGLLLASFFPPKSRDAFWKGSALAWLLWLAGVHFFPLRVLSDRLLDKLEPAKASFLFLFCAMTAVAVGLEERIQFTSKKNKVWSGPPRFLRSPRGWAWALGALWVLDLFLVPARVIQTVPDPYQDPQVRQAAAKAARWAGEGRVVSLRDPSRYYSAAVTDFAGSIRETAADLTPNTNVVWGIPSARGYLTIYTDGFQDLDRYLQRGYPYDGRILDAAGVGLLVLDRALPAFKYRLSQPEGNSVFVRNAGALSRAWVVEKVREFPDRPSVFEALLDPRAFLEDEVYTEKSPDGRSVCLAPAGRGLDGESPGLLRKFQAFTRGLWGRPATVREDRPSPCEARFEVTASKAGFLVFDESFAPGWNAWVDGSPKPVFRADGLFMAVPLASAGAHQVSFRYEPVSFRLGLFLSLLFAVGGAAVLALRPKGTAVL